MLTKHSLLKQQYIYYHATTLIMNLAQESIVMQPGDVEGDAAIIQQFKQFVDTFKSTFGGFYYKNTLL